MNQETILAPLVAMIWVTVAVLIYLFAKRMPFIASSGMKPSDITPAELARRAPPSVATPSDNLKNLFEIPVLFYALCLTLFVSGQVDQTYVTLAWVFVSFRALHSLIHCTFNNVSARFAAYLVSCVTLIWMLVRLTVAWVSV